MFLLFCGSSCIFKNSQYAEIYEIREKQRNVECQKRKLIEKSLGEVPMKKARVCASVPKQASKKKSKKKSNVKTTTAT